MRPGDRLRRRLTQALSPNGIYRMNTRTFFVLFFIFITGCSSGYVVENGNVYYVIWNEGQGKVEKKLNADTKSFTALDRSKYLWAKDKSSVFYKGRLVPNADPDSFTILNNYYAKDKNNVFGGCKLIPDVDIKSFETLKNKWQDKELSFHAKDKNNGYLYFEYVLCSTYVFKDIDHQTFEALAYLYARDSKNVFRFNKTLEKANPETFRLLHDAGNYTTDGVNVYYDGKLIPEADAKSFKVTGYSSASDKNQKYVYELSLKGWCESIKNNKVKCNSDI